jgi:hypothetical protein
MDSKDLLVISSSVLFISVATHDESGWIRSLRVVMSSRECDRISSTRTENFYEFLAITKQSFGTLASISLNAGV